MREVATILIVEDDERVCRLLSEYLTREGYRVKVTRSGAGTRDEIAASPPDLILLDLMLPDADGFELAKEIRAGSEIPMIMLTGKSDTVDKVVGLEIGADDYITKPFDKRELLARVRTVLRRARVAGRTGKPDAGRRFRFAGWDLDLLAHDLISPRGESVALTSVQFQLLAALLERANEVVSRSELMKRLSGREWTPLDRSIDVQIWRLRRKIEDDPKRPRLIRTVRGTGYELTCDVEKS